MEHTTLMLIAEAVLRVILGWRFLISGLSNVGRWPNPVQTASILFPRGATFFGLVATLLMVVGGLGVAAGLQTPLCSAMVIIFLIPTFVLHSYWLKVLPTMAPVVKAALNDEKAQNYFRFGFSKPRRDYRPATKRPGLSKPLGSNCRLVSRMSGRVDGGAPHTSMVSFRRGGAAKIIACPPRSCAREVRLANHSIFALPGSTESHNVPDAASLIIRAGTSPLFRSLTSVMTSANCERGTVRR